MMYFSTTFPGSGHLKKDVDKVPELELIADSEQGGP